MINARENSLKNITASLTGYVGYVRTLTRMNLNDGAVIAENEFMDLLNLLYGWKMVNANTEKANAPGIDLVDKAGKIIVQVSVSDTREKIRHTLSELQDKQHDYDGYRLLFFFISIDTNALRDNKGYDHIPPHINFVHKGPEAFDRKSDILDIETLITKINYLPYEQMEAVERLTTRMFNVFPFFRNNESYQKLIEEKYKLEEKIAKTRMALLSDPDNELYRDIYQQYESRYNEVIEQLPQEQQNIFDLAKQIAQLQGQKINERIKRAIEAFEAGSILKAKTILAEAEYDFEIHCQSVDQELSLVFARFEELQLKVKIIMADTATRIDSRIAEALPLWKKVHDATLKYNYEAHDAEKYEQILVDYSSFLRRYGYFSESLSIQKGIYEFQKNHRGEKHEDTIHSLYEIGVLLLCLDRYPEAILYFETVIDYTQKLKNNNKIGLADLYDAIGEAHRLNANYPEALQYLKKSLKYRKQFFGHFHPAIAASYNNLGSLYYSIGYLPKALTYIKKALATQEEIFDTRSIESAQSRKNIGVILHSLGQYRKAMDYSQEALETFIEILGESHPATAQSYNNVGEIFHSMCKYELALKYLTTALDIRRRIIGDKQVDTAQSYASLGSLYCDMKDYPKALECYEKSLDIRKSVQEDNHPEIGLCLRCIGVVYFEKGEFHKALKAFKDAKNVLKQKLGDNHADLISVQKWIRKCQSHTYTDNNRE